MIGVRRQTQIYVAGVSGRRPLIPLSGERGRRFDRVSAPQLPVAVRRLRFVMFRWLRPRLLRVLGLVATLALVPGGSERLVDQGPETG